MSATLGIKGCSVNIGQNGTYLNTGIPGTGLYDRKRIDIPNGNEKIDTSPASYDKYNYRVETEIKSYATELLTSDSMLGFKKSIIDAEKVKKEMYQEWRDANSSKNWTLFILVLLHFIIIGFFLKPLKNNYKNKKRFAEELKSDYESFSVEIDFNFDKETLNDYCLLKESFEKIVHSQRIWDITSYKNINSVQERTSATRAITRKPVKFYKTKIDFIKTEYEAFVFENANGGNLYLYPGFIIMKEDASKDFAIVDLKSLEFDFYQSRFIEEESVPSDSETIDYTWKYCNKKGSPDRRYASNYKIPIQLYATITFKSNEGLNEEYMLSNKNTCENFSKYFSAYLNTLQEMTWSPTKEIEET